MEISLLSGVIPVQVHSGSHTHTVSRFPVLSSLYITVPFNNMWNLTVISQLTVKFFAAVNHHLNICMLAINRFEKQKSSKWIEENTAF